MFLMTPHVFNVINDSNDDTELHHMFSMLSMTVMIILILIITTAGIGWDRNAPERRSGSFFEDRNSVPVLFYDLELCYLPLFNTSSLFFRSVHCALAPL